MENDNKIPDESNSESKDSETKEETLANITQTILPEPLTKHLPPSNVYHLEQMKNGLSISNIPIVKNRLIFGRARDCDIPMDHPSISRYDFDYKTDAMHNKFKCTFELPIDGQWIPVEGQLMTKKKEAITDACLRCCKLLDQASLLFAWQRKDSAREKARKEFYDDDDDDDLLDETVKSKNKKLKKDTEKVENYDSLNAKWKEINTELCQLKVRLATIGLEPGVTPEIPENLTDSLDVFMNSLNQKKFGLSMNEKIEKSNLRIKIKQLEQEQTKIEKLIQLAKPVEIIIKNFTPKTQSSTGSENKIGIETEKKPAKVITEELKNEKVDESSNNNKCETENKNSKKSYKEIRKIRQESTIEAIEREKRLEKQ
ncbi:coiled-coil protein, partial [Euroglyphus maynei]